MNGRGVRDWYLSHATHSPWIQFPLSSYTLDMCFKTSPKWERRVCFQKPNLLQRNRTSLISLTTREREKAMLWPFREYGVGWGWGTMHKTMVLLSQGSAELWWTHSNHEAPIAADQRGCHWPTIAQLSFAQIGILGKRLWLSCCLL